MSLRDRFRIDELTKTGSKSIVRSETGDIVVRKVNNKEIKPVSLSDRPKPYGEEPIKSKKTTPTLRAEVIEPPKEINPQQESFSGETSTHIERPFYNEEELKKAVDLKVDELIKQKKPQRGNFIRKEKYDAETGRLRNENRKLQEEVREKQVLQSQIQNLQSQVESLQTQTQAALDELTTKDQTLQTLIGRYEQTVADLQNAVIKGTKEAVERAALSAQVQGLKAQKETLSAQLVAQRGINETLQSQLVTTRESFQSLLKTQQETAKAIQQQGQDVLESVQLQLDNAQTQAERDRIEAQRRQEQLAAEQARLEAEAAQLRKNQKKKIICNELYNQGYLPKLIWDADEKFGDMMFEIDPKLVIGYQMWARKVVKFMKENPQYTSSISFILKPWTLWMAHQMGTLPKTNWRGYLTHIVGKQFSYLVYDLFGGKKILDRYNKVLG